MTPNYLKRRRRSYEAEGSDLELQLEVFNETLDLSLKFNHDILDSTSAVFVRKDDNLEIWHGENPDCFLEGKTSKRGVVSLSYCHGIVSF